MNVSLENDYLKVRINEKGAELTSCNQQRHGIGIYVEWRPCFLGKDFADIISDCWNTKKRQLSVIRISCIP